MTAEKEIVNFWYNRKGFFTINNLKTSNNRDAGIIALKPGKDNSEVFHVQVSCSITNNIAETKNLGVFIEKIAEEKFYNEAVSSTIKKLPNRILLDSQIKKVIVLGSMPKSRKAEISKEFLLQDVEVVEFEDILYDVMKNLDTQYFKSDVMRTLQLVKYLLLNEPSKMAQILSDDNFTSNSRKEFLSSILENDEIIKEFRKTNVERLSAIIRNSSIKPSELAQLIENSVLNNRTRKPFIDSLMSQESNRKSVNKTKRVRKKNISLAKFL